MANKSASRIIQVTGFDVFNGFETSNPSWAAVSLLPDTIQLNGQSFSIQKHKVPVTYSAVDAKIDELWTNRPVVSVQYPLTDIVINWLGTNIAYSFIVDGSLWGAQQCQKYLFGEECA